MADNKRQDGGAGIGMASVLMIIVVLALTCVGVLALSSARTDLAMSTSAVSFSADYYEALGRIQNRIAAIDRKLADGKSELAVGDETVIKEVFSEDRVLAARISITDSGDGIGRAQLVHSEVVSTSEWSPEGGANIWDGGF